MIAIIDYGAGNIFSVKNALDYIGLPSILTNKKEDLINADGLILPGVGAFPSAMKMLKEIKEVVGDDVLVQIGRAGLEVDLNLFPF